MFNNINYNKLINILKEKIADIRVLNLIRKIIKIKGIPFT